MRTCFPHRGGSHLAEFGEVVVFGTRRQLCLPCVNEFLKDFPSLGVRSEFHQREASEVTRGPWSQFLGGRLLKRGARLRRFP